MADDKTPLTDAQIREFLHLQVQHYLKLGAAIATIEKALVNKGLLTEADIAEAQKQVKQEGDDQIAKIGRAIRQGPAGGVQ